MAELPFHSILNTGRHFLRIKVEQRTDVDRAQYRAVLEGDATVKELCEWTNSLPDATAAFDAERARYR